MPKINKLLKVKDSCGTCRYLTGDLRQDIYPPTMSYYCGHYDLIELDTNGGGQWLGFIPLVKDWCPLLRENGGRGYEQPLSPLEIEN